ncbi:hypothetical protein J5N97_005353 [Dioscorea zingiberensis]|uniref:Phytocyanin domain-containing protein n=1 Tax=Dioscorea zingiberensis TaxID=325984 RepID=A0A9D5DAK6_9LILI|nr:hypothetical protein J5N97_005353 [Dioscorea zingiberensis]
MAGLFGSLGFVAIVVGVVAAMASFGVVVASEGMHHLVGGDPGWDAASDVGAWSYERIFRVGDYIWFTYSAEKDSIVELGSRAEFESCDTGNPIRMYTSGLDKVVLDGEGTRFFVSSKLDNCRNGLKLHLNVMPHDQNSEKKAMEMPSYHASALAAGPQPSGSSSISAAAAASLLICIWLAVASFMAF